MQATGCKSHPVACIRVIDQWSMTRMRAFVSLTAVNDTNARIRVIDHWSMTRMHATGCDLHPVACIHVIDHWSWSMTRMRTTECDLHPVACIRVIDQWSMTRMRATECDLHPVACIRVIDHPIRNYK